jgi:hypothetical protein
VALAGRAPGGRKRVQAAAQLVLVPAGRVAGARRERETRRIGRMQEEEQCAGRAPRAARHGWMARVCGENVEHFRSMIEPPGEHRVGSSTVLRQENAVPCQPAFPGRARARPAGPAVDWRGGGAWPCSVARNSFPALPPARKRLCWVGRAFGYLTGHCRPPHHHEPQPPKHAKRAAGESQGGSKGARGAAGLAMGVARRVSRR